MWVHTIIRGVCNCVIVYVVEQNVVALASTYVFAPYRTIHDVEMK